MVKRKKVKTLAKLSQAKDPAAFSDIEIKKIDVNDVIPYRSKLDTQNLVNESEEKLSNGFILQESSTKNMTSKRKDRMKTIDVDDVIPDRRKFDPQNLINELEEKLNHDIILQESSPKTMASNGKDSEESNQISLKKIVNSNGPTPNVSNSDGMSWKDKLLWNRRLDALVKLQYSAPDMKDGIMVAEIESMDVEKEIQRW